MKIYTVEFAPLWPVGCGLVIAAQDMDEAIRIASETIKHTQNFAVTEVDISLPCVIHYQSGDY